MGDGFKINKDKRHRSSSSLAGTSIDKTRSEKKLDIRASIPEIEDQFSLAAARCDDLQEKIDLVKALKRKKKLKKRSMTRVSNQCIDKISDQNMPIFTVKTKPKMKVSQPANRTRNLKTLPNPTGYFDSATVEQHRMLGQMREYNDSLKQAQEETKNRLPESTKNVRRKQVVSNADGDSICRTHKITEGVACGRDDVISEPYDFYGERYLGDRSGAFKKSQSIGKHVSAPSNRNRRHVPKDVLLRSNNEVQCNSEVTAQDSWHPAYEKLKTSSISVNKGSNKQEERPVVEIFNKDRKATSPDARNSLQPTGHKKNRRVVREVPPKDDDTGPVEPGTPPDTRRQQVAEQNHGHTRTTKYRSHRYELPTLASQMKQASTRHFYGNTNQSNLPFVVSKNVGPSHNIGVNIQQVLNGLKMQQPLSRIPLTIAHHMGLRHVPTYNNKNPAQPPSLDNREINAIKLGERLLRLPTYNDNSLSYTRVLNMYREGDGIVPRFLRGISRPHYFYTSMYNLTNRDDMDAATSKGCGVAAETKQILAEYANMYREYQIIDKGLKEGNVGLELERRRDQLAKELADREEHIRKVVQDYKNGSSEVDHSTLRASASTAEGAGYRHSTFKLNFQ